MKVKEINRFFNAEVKRQKRQAQAVRDQETNHEELERKERLGYIAARQAIVEMQLSKLNKLLTEAVQGEGNQFAAYLDKILDGSICVREYTVMVKTGKKAMLSFLGFTGVEIVEEVHNEKLVCVLRVQTVNERQQIGLYLAAESCPHGKKATSGVGPHFLFQRVSDTSMGYEFEDIDYHEETGVDDALREVTAGGLLGFIEWMIRQIGPPNS